MQVIGRRISKRFSRKTIYREAADLQPSYQGHIMPNGNGGFASELDDEASAFNRNCYLKGESKIMVDDNIKAKAESWISRHSEPSDCEHCNNLGWWKLIRIATVKAMTQDIHNRSIATLDVPTPHVVLLECNNCKEVTYIDESKLSQ